MDDWLDCDDCCDRASTEKMEDCDDDAEDDRDSW